jgi:hypothetical protein
LAKKNKANGMSEDYERAQRRRFLKETKIVQDFLADPENDKLRHLYEVATADFNLKIIAKRSPEEKFDVVMEYLYDLLIGRDPILRGKKALTRAVLYYMYWNCDLGLNPGDVVEVDANAPAN